jgi:hypothetical protein
VTSRNSGATIFIRPRTSNGIGWKKGLGKVTPSSTTRTPRQKQSAACKA